MANALTPVQVGLNQVSNAVNNASQALGTLTGGTPILNGADNTLPAELVPNFRTGTLTRDIIHWFVPEFGIVKMYVNPANINYKMGKLINKDRTKGGFVLSYWGENLTTLAISGTTGSSGIEGIQVLEQIYRAEQYAFDAVGQTLAANSAAVGANAAIIGGIGSALSQTSGSAVGGGSFGGVLGSGVAQGIFGANTFTALAPRNIPTLASLAFGVEMFYSGWIYRGYFEDFSFVESASNMGFFEYTLNFTATQRMGMRYNQFAYQRSAIDGPSNNQQDGGIPLSWLKLNTP
jgi:hypothetical protein